MPIAFPSSPTVGQEYPFGGKTWRYLSAGYWTAVRQFNEYNNGFQNPVMQGWYETLVESAPNPVTNTTGVQLTYL